MLSSSKIHAEQFIQFLDQHQNDVRLWLFVANCCLLSAYNSEQQQVMIKELSNSIAIRLARLHKNDDLSEYLSRMLESSLKNRKEGFDLLLKEFILKQSFSNLHSVTEYVNALVKLVNIISSMNYQVHSLPAETNRFIFALFADESTKKTDEDLLSFAKQYRGTGRLRLGHKEHNKCFQDLVEWAKSYDNKRQEEIRKNALKIAAAKRGLRNIHKIALFAFIIWVTQIVMEYLPAMGWGIYSSMGVASLFIVPTIGILSWSQVSSQNKLLKSNDNKELEKFKESKEKQEKELAGTLNQFFNLKLSQNIAEFVTDSRKEQQLILSITPAEKNSNNSAPSNIDLSNPKQEKIRTKKRVWKFSNPIIRDFKTPKPSHGLLLEYESTTKHLIRRISKKNGGEITVMFSRLLKKQIDKEKYTLFRKTFLEKGIAKKEGTPGLKFLGKNEMEIKVMQFDDRVYGNDSRYAPAIEFHTFVSGGFHKKK